MNEPACDCSQQTWDRPTATTIDIYVGSTQTLTLPLPTANTNASPAIRACGTSCSTASAAGFTEIIMGNGSALEYWITP